mgnify:FL=1
MEAHFGPVWAYSYAKDVVIAELAGRTISQALAEGVETKEIWRAVCRHEPTIPASLR